MCECANVLISFLFLFLLSPPPLIQKTPIPKKKVMWTANIATGTIQTSTFTTKLNNPALLLLWVAVEHVHWSIQVRTARTTIAATLVTHQILPITARGNQ